MKLSVSLASRKEEAWRLVEERAKGPPRWGCRVTKKSSSLASESKLTESKKEEVRKKKSMQLVAPSMTSMPMAVIPCIVADGILGEDAGESCLSRTISPAFPSESEGESLPVTPAPSPSSPLGGIFMSSQAFNPHDQSASDTQSLNSTLGSRREVSLPEVKRGKLPFKKRRKHGGPGAKATSSVATIVSTTNTQYGHPNQVDYFVAGNHDSLKREPSPKLPKKKRAPEFKNSFPPTSSSTIYNLSDHPSVSLPTSSYQQQSSSSSIYLNAIPHSTNEAGSSMSSVQPLNPTAREYSTIISDNMHFCNASMQSVCLNGTSSTAAAPVSSFSHDHHADYLLSHASAPVMETKVKSSRLSYTVEDETAAAEALVSVVQSVFVAAMEGPKPSTTNNSTYKPNECATAVSVPDSNLSTISSGQSSANASSPHFVAPPPHSMEKTLQTSSLLASLQMKQQEEHYQLHRADEKYQTSSPAAAAAELAALADSTGPSSTAILAPRIPTPAEAKQRSNSLDTAKFVKRSRSLSEPFGTLSATSKSSSTSHLLRRTPIGNFGLMSETAAEHRMQEVLPTVTNFHHPHENPEVLSCKFPHTLPFYQPIYNKNKNVGIYTPSQRKELLEKFRNKRHMRKWNKKVIRYNCRKDLADRRLRVKGRFVKRDENGGHLLPTYNNGEHALFSTAPGLSISESEEQIKREEEEEDNYEDHDEVLYDGASPESPYRRHRRVTVA